MKESERFKKFGETFDDHFKKKNYRQCFESINNLLDFNEKFVDKVQYDLYARLLVLSITSMIALKSVNVSIVKRILIKFESLVLSNSIDVNELQLFISLECAMQLIEFPNVIDQTMVDRMVNKVLSVMETWSAEKAKMDQETITKFIMVVVEMESLMGGKSLSFTMAKKTLQFFENKILTKPQIESGWPELLAKTLEICQLSTNSTHTAKQLVKQVRQLSSDENQFRQDIAIMICQIIAACSSSISKSCNLQFLQNIFLLLEIGYDIIRDKTVTSNRYCWLLSYEKVCCDSWEKHMALKILETVRKLFIHALDGNNINEALVSTCVNFMVAEATVVERLNCKKRQALFININKDACHITDNINKIITTCGKERGVRTINKFLSIPTKDKYLDFYKMATALIEIYTEENQTLERINLCTLRFLNARQNQKTYAVFQIHKAQSKLDSSEFMTIPTIFSKLDKSKLYSLSFDPLMALFIQLRVEIEYPTLNEECRNKLIEEISGMDIYKNNTHAYIYLIKANVRVLQSMIDIAYYKSNKVMSLKYELDLITKLQDSLDCFSKFLKKKDIWTVDVEKDTYLSNMVTMLNKIGLWLMTRQFKDLAMNAFNMLYTVAKMSNNLLQQIVAAGCLVENIRIHSYISIEEEFVTELQNNISLKLKDVDKMSPQEFCDFLMGFSQLAIYALRHQNNVKHAKIYMQAINKLLTKYDGENTKYVALQLKYFELMFEVVKDDPTTVFTPITLIEDIFLRFKNAKFTSITDINLNPIVLFDILSTLYAYTHARYDFKQTSSLMWTLYHVSLQKGYLLLLVKVHVLLANEHLHTSFQGWENRFAQLDIIFDCKAAAPTITWNNEISPLIHSTNCNCYQCSSRLVNMVKMEVAAVKAYASYYVKDYEKSLQSFQCIYDHWANTDDAAYISMLMNYSSCLNRNGRIHESKDLLSEALDSCNKSEDNYYAQTLDISTRLCLNAVTDETDIEMKPPYVSAIKKYRPKAVASRAASSATKKKTVTQPKPRIR